MHWRRMRRLRIAAVLCSMSLLGQAARAATPGPGEPELDAVLQRAAGYVAAYREKLALVRATERYSQKATFRDFGVAARRSADRERHASRRLVSDVLWVPSDDVLVLAFYRDVYSVDDAPVRDREDRLSRLFPDGATNKASAKGLQILTESARYNLGRAVRNANFPTLALSFLHPAHQPRFEFRAGRTETVERRRALELQFRETAHPTLISTTSGEDVPARGSIWVASEDGAIVKTELLLGIPPGVPPVRLRVEYRWDGRLDLFVPAVMRESYGGDKTREQIEATASYGDYRRGDAEIGPLRFR